MDESEFWRLVEESGGDEEKLEQLLTGRPADELVEFDRIYHEQLARSYRWDLWGAGYLMQGGMSDDAFDYFRDWLIGRGRERFEKVLADPDALADVAEPYDELDNEGLRYAVQKAHEKTHGGELAYADLSDFPDEPAGEEWDEDDPDALDARFPRIAAKVSG
jgi:hypothetical protein